MCTTERCLMFYRFSQFSGRLSQANAETAYYPQVRCLRESK